MTRKKIKLNNMQIISLGFVTIIIIGSLLLCCPLASRTGTWTPYFDSLFTSTSATCVTGLIAFDTFTHWSLFGQIVIITLIQIGGIGFMTIVTMLSIVLKRHIGLNERKLLMESAGSMKIAGVVALIKRICIGTFIFEGLGAVMLSIRFIPEMGMLRGIYNAVFHSISAFCNAGFDLMGRYAPCSSLTRYQDDVIVNVTIMALIVIGGVGFFVWNDILFTKCKYKKFQLHTKIVLVTTGALILIGFVLFFFLEYNHAFKNLSFGNKIMASFFQSITPRTAGFNTINLTELSTGGTIITYVLMFIGGSPGSTAGGIKTTTFLVLMLEAIAFAKNKSQVTIFKRRIDEATLRQASIVVSIYVTAVTVACIVICATQDCSISDTLFEVISAISTVGLTKGITPTHDAVTQITLIMLMYLGRVGVLTFAISIARRKKNIPLDRPIEKLIVG